MKNGIMIFFAIVLCSLFIFDCFMFPQSEIAEIFKTKKAKLETFSNNGFAVVELFTSEGCSSCPPAEELMVQLQKEAKDKNIYLLAYHVDYWDRLGWKDKFSSNEFTIRQQKYQDWLNLSVIYTPQFIINGTSEFAGYDKTALFDEVSEALRIKPNGNLKITAHTVADSINIDFKTDHIQENSSLFIAAVQKQAFSKVQRGENKGSTLHHVQIVRQLKSFPLNKNAGSITLEKPSDFNPNDWELICFVQNTITGKISKTVKADLVF